MDYKYYVCAESHFGSCLLVRGFMTLKEAMEFFATIVGKYYSVSIRNESLKCRPVCVEE